jgi:hypothetical protein
MSEPEFFVGYLPMPRALRRFALIAALVASLLVLGAGYVLARSTTGGGRAQFRGGATQGQVGVLTVRPTAMLWTLDPAAVGGVRGTLLVRQGKFGLGERAAALDGQVVRVDGAIIERDGRRMIELARLPEAASGTLSAPDQTRITARAKAQGQPVTLEGEIVDSKCWLGRMRPGAQRTHRACAQLCIAGGIPAMFVTRAANGQEQAYVLADRQGGPLGDEVLPYVAEPVRLSGEPVVEGDVSFLRIDVAKIERL